MKKTSLFILSIAFGLTLTGCPNNPGDGGKEDNKVHVEMSADLSETTTSYDLAVNYDDSYFLQNPETYNPNLAELSFASSLASSSDEKGNKFFNDLKFKDMASYQMAQTPDENSLGYIFAHKVLDDAEVVAISIRGFGYGKEWANNFLVGESGDHEGFLTRSTEVYTNLASYINMVSPKDKPLKLWMAGYSRGGGIANVLSSLILREANNFALDQTNVYTYTFEAPRGLTQEHAVAYPNVKNIVNKADLVTYVAPEEYGLYRCGVDYEIYTENVVAAVHSFDETITIPTFLPIDTTVGNEVITLSNDYALVQYMLNTILHATSDDETVLLNTRQQYVDNYEEMFKQAIGLFMSLPSETMSAIKDDFSSKGFLEILSIVSSGETLMAYLKPFLDNANVQYDEAALTTQLGKLLGAAFGTLSPILGIAMGEQKSDLSRLLDMHYPEVTYSLLCLYNKSID